jgi:hypothetical protein
MQPLACHSERSEAALLRCPEPLAKELVAPRPFTEFTLSEAEGFRAAAVSSILPLLRYTAPFIPRSARGRCASDSGAC